MRIAAGRSLRRPGQAPQWTGYWFNGARPEPPAWHHPLPDGRLTMSRRSSVSACGNPHTYGLRGGWGDPGRPAAPAPLTTSPRKMALSRGGTQIGRIGYDPVCRELGRKVTQRGWTREWVRRGSGCGGAGGLWSGRSMMAGPVLGRWGWLCRVWIRLGDLDGVAREDAEAAPGPGRRPGHPGGCGRSRSDARGRKMRPSPPVRHLTRRRKRRPARARGGPWRARPCGGSPRRSRRGRSVLVDLGLAVAPIGR